MTSFAWLVGICTAMGAVGLALAFAAQARGRVRIALACLMLASVFLKLPSLLDPALHPWDERYHALVAKHMMVHPLRPTLLESPATDYDYRQWTVNHVWLHKPPLALWMMAASMRLFGLNVVALRLPSMVLSTLSIALTCALGRRLFGVGAGFLAAYFHAICAPLLLLAGGREPVDHVDTAFIFFIELGVYLALRQATRFKWHGIIAIGLTVAAAVLTKWAAGLLILAIWQALPMSGSWRRRAIELPAVLLIVAALAGAWNIYIHHAFPAEAQWEQSYSLRHFSEVLEGHDSPWYFHFQNIADFFGILSLPAIIGFAALAWRRGGRMGYAALVVWFGLTYAFFSMARTRMPGYVLIAAPAVMLMMGWFWWQVYQWSSRGTIRWFLRGLVALSLLTPLWPGYAEVVYCSGWPEDDTRQACIFMQQQPQLAHADNAVVFDVQHPIELMFFTPVTAYWGSPLPADVQRLKSQGRRVFVCEHGQSGLRSVPRTVQGKEMLSVPPGF